MRTTVVHPHRGLRWRPDTRAGRLALVLAGTALGGLVLLAAAFGAGWVESADTFTDSWVLTGWGAAVLLSGLASVGAGIVSLVRDHERSWVVTVATVLGALVSLAVVNEIVQGIAGGALGSG